VRLASLHSGGKDSSLALYIAEQMGHVVEYIVNIVPSSEDSMIFHVPNSDMVPLIAEASGKRLIRSITKGSEEDDMKALREALIGLDIEGVVIGAVLSDYQWDRVNRVCGDLDLICLAPLWRKSQEDVMAELIDSGISAIIAGVYADGLDDSWLGRNICGSYDDLKKIKGISIIGEGGEYESLTLDSPLQTHVLELINVEKTGDGHSGTMHVKSARLVKK